MDLSDRPQDLCPGDLLSAPHADGFRGIHSPHLRLSAAHGQPQGQVFDHTRRQNPTTCSLTHFLQKLHDLIADSFRAVVDVASPARREGSSS